MFINRLDASIATRPEVSQRSMVIVGPGFFLGIVQLAVLTSLTVTLEPFVKDKGFTIMAGKHPESTGPSSSRQ
jgi:hypothetical protein